MRLERHGQECDCATETATHRAIAVFLVGARPTQARLDMPCPVKELGARASSRCFSHGVRSAQRRKSRDKFCSACFADGAGTRVARSRTALMRGSSTPCPSRKAKNDVVMVLNGAVSPLLVAQAGMPCAKAWSWAGGTGGVPGAHLYFCTGCGKLLASGRGKCCTYRVPWKMVRGGFSLKPTYYFAGLRFSVHLYQRGARHAAHS